MRLSDRVALVTGAATGIGRAIAEALAREGARIAVNYSRSQAEAESVVAAIREGGGDAFAVCADVAQEPQAIAMVGRVEERWGRLDILVNNAAWTTPVPHERLEALTDEIWDRTLAVNLRGPFNCIRAAVPLLRRSPDASIVNVTSVAAINGLGSSIVYCASKGGLESMTKSLARALAPEIRVNAVAPGMLRTRFIQRPEAVWEQGADQTPMERLSSIEDVAAAVFYLAADAGSVTGESIVVDGGVIRLGRKLAGPRRPR